MPHCRHFSYVFHGYFVTVITKMPSDQIRVLFYKIPPNTSMSPMNSEVTVVRRIDPLVGNDSVNTFPREPTRAIGRLLLGNGSVNIPKQYGTTEDDVFRGVHPEAT
jgi:hypothetical protein